ncbi:MAG: hypothetical protein KJ077_25900 [Anaerolineae bacterium]|nr:hypothetical protein [Anaerolineae bacterium]
MVDQAVEDGPSSHRRKATDGFSGRRFYKKHSGWGEVTLRLGRSEGTLKIEVVDTGIGIKPEHRDLVFMKFYRTTNSRLHSSGKTKFIGTGPGLGLYLGFQSPSGLIILTPLT